MIIQLFSATLLALIVVYFILIRGRGLLAKMLFVGDPSRLKLVMSSENFTCILFFVFDSPLIRLLVPPRLFYMKFFESRIFVDFIVSRI